jgi:DNA-binding transcriptional ArsR family regulator
MTLTYDVKRVLADDGGWMTVRQVCAVLDRGREVPVRGGKVHACLRVLAERGRVEAVRHPDADAEYRLVGEPTCKPFVDNARHREYIRAMPDGEFSARDMARRMGVTRQVATRHLARCVDDGLLERIGENRRTVYRKVRT